jgi:hypothetical protein
MSNITVTRKIIISEGIDKTLLILVTCGVIAPTNEKNTRKKKTAVPWMRIFPKFMRFSFFPWWSPTSNQKAFDLIWFAF